MLRQCVNTNVMIAELRYSLGQILDENGNRVCLKEEIDIIEHELRHVQDDHPHFKLKLILTDQNIID